MKKIITLLFFFCYSFVFAQPSGILDGYRFEANNRLGGKIVLTTNKCVINGEEIPGAFSGYGFSGSGSTSDGCWVLIDDRAHMQWRGGQKSIYNLDTFEMIVPRQVTPSNQRNNYQNGNL
jgi:hypothetical protein